MVEQLRRAPTKAPKRPKPPKLPKAPKPPKVRAGVGKIKVKRESTKDRTSKKDGKTAKKPAYSAKKLQKLCGSLMGDATGQNLIAKLVRSYTYEDKVKKLEKIKKALTELGQHIGIYIKENQNPKTMGREFHYNFPSGDLELGLWQVATNESGMHPEQTRDMYKKLNNLELGPVKDVRRKAMVSKKLAKVAMRADTLQAAHKVKPAFDASGAPVHGKVIRKRSPSPSHMRHPHSRPDASRGIKRPQHAKEDRPLKKRQEVRQGGVPVHPPGEASHKPPAPVEEGEIPTSKDSARPRAKSPNRYSDRPQHRSPARHADRSPHRYDRSPHRHDRSPNRHGSPPGSRYGGASHHSSQRRGDAPSMRGDWQRGGHSSSHHYSSGGRHEHHSSQRGGDPPSMQAASRHGGGGGRGSHEHHSSQRGGDPPSVRDSHHQQSKDHDSGRSYAYAQSHAPNTTAERPQGLGEGAAKLDDARSGGRTLQHYDDT